MKRRFTDAEVADYRDRARWTSISKLAKEAGCAFPTMSNLIFGHTYPDLPGALLTKEELADRAWPTRVLPEDTDEKAKVLNTMRSTFWGDPDVSVSEIARMANMTPSYARAILRGDVTFGPVDKDTYLNFLECMNTREIAEQYDARMQLRKTWQREREEDKKEEIWLLREQGLLVKDIVKKTGLKPRRIHYILAEMKERNELLSEGRF